MVAHVSAYVPARAYVSDSYARIYIYTHTYTYTYAHTHTERDRVYVPARAYV